MRITVLGSRQFKALILLAMLGVGAVAVGAIRLLRWIDETSAIPSAAEARGIIFTAEALRWLGTPYALGGEGPQSMDCSGFVHRVIEDSGFLPGREAPRLSREWGSYGVAVKDQILPGDILLFKGGGKVDHVAIALSKDRFIHAASRGPKRGVVISSIFEPYWRASFAGARRIGGE